jgi:hypothetical protein
MRDDDDDRFLPPPAEVDAPTPQRALVVAEPVRERRPAGSVATHLLAAAAGAFVGIVGLVGVWVVLEALESNRGVVGPDRRSDPPPAPPQPVGRGLRSLDGSQVRLLPSGRVQLVNVWLEGCADCMPAFEAWKQLVADEKLPPGIPIANVAYVRASEPYARKYRVLEGLVVDDGSNVVRPLGISRFTTLVVAPDGRVCHQDSPDRPGYLERLGDAITSCAR